MNLQYSCDSDGFFNLGQTAGYLRAALARLRAGIRALPEGGGDGGAVLVEVEQCLERIVEEMEGEEGECGWCLVRILPGVVAEVFRDTPEREGDPWWRQSALEALVNVTIMGRASRGVTSADFQRVFKAEQGLKDVDPFLAGQKRLGEGRGLTWAEHEELVVLLSFAKVM